MIVMCDGREAFSRAREARGFLERLVGLMGRREVGPQEALLFRECHSVHSMFMRTPIDAVYLDDLWRVLEVETLEPWRVGRSVPGCAHVLECAPGAASERGIRPGSRLALG